MSKAEFTSNCESLNKSGNYGIVKVISECEDIFPVEPFNSVASTPEVPRKVLKVTTDFETISYKPSYQTDIQDYCARYNLPLPESMAVAKNTKAFSDNQKGYKILKSPTLTDQDFAISAYAPGTHKIAIICCHKSVSIVSVKNMFNKLWEDNTPAVVEVGIISGGINAENKFEEILNFLEGQKNIKINFSLTQSSGPIAVDTNGNFSTNCENIYHNEELRDCFDDFINEILPFSPSVVVQGSAFDII